MLIRRLLLVLLFLLAQAGALAHGIGHGVGQPDQGLGHEACALCLAYVPLGVGVASTPPVWAPPAAVCPSQAPLPAAVFTACPRPYLSRAPPPC